MSITLRYQPDSNAAYLRLSPNAVLESEEVQPSVVFDRDAAWHIVGIEFLDATDTLSPVAPWRLVNIGGGEPVGLLEFICTIENCLGRRAIRRMLPMQQGDMGATFADHRLLEALTGYRPATRVAEGVAAFVEWYLSKYSKFPAVAA